MGVKGYYHMHGRDSETGFGYSWFIYGPKPDFEGVRWPGKSKPVGISVIEKRTTPVSTSCDEYLVSGIMAE